MALLDWILILVLGLSLLRGLWRGAVSQLFGIMGFIAGFFLAQRFGPDLGARLAAVFSSLPHPAFIAAALLFMLTWFLVALAGAWISRGLRSGGVGGTDRLLGGALGLVKGGLGVLVLVWAIGFLFPPDHPLFRDSRLLPYAQAASRFLIEAAPKSFQERMDDMSKKVPKLSPEKDAKIPGSKMELKDRGENQDHPRKLSPQ